MSAGNGSGMHFIVSTDVKKANPETRKLIRSHVMQGNNRVKSRPAKQPRVASRAIMVDPNQIPLVVSLDELVEMCHSFIPRRIGSDLSFTKFAAEITPAMFGNVVHFCGLVTRVMFPLGGFIGWDKEDKTWFELLTADATFLHIAAFAAGAFIDTVWYQQEQVTNPEATLHYLKGVRMLREKLLLQDEGAKLSDSTVSVILTLANCAYNTGEYETGRQHLEGLLKIAKLRGGLATFRSNNFSKKLLMEMLRVDIGMAFHTGSEPMFFGNSFSEPLLPYPDQKLWVIGKSTDISHSVNFLEKIDEDLGAAWVAMQRFCSLVNLAMETHRVFSLEIVLDTMAAVMYRLLRMRFETGSINEAIRLGLLSLSYRIFLQRQDMGFSSFRFPSIYRNSLSNLKLADGFPPGIMLWLLMIGGISRFASSDNAWLKDSLQEHMGICHVKSWDELRGTRIAA